MKKFLFILMGALIMASCAKQDLTDQGTDKWNGYENHLKELGVHTLWAGRNINVGTVTYEIDYNANFVVTYQCIPGWTMSETHMYAGSKKNMPLNKPGSPKIGQFTKNNSYNPRVSTVVYTIPLTQLPSQQSGGFVVASHCVVTGPNKTETGWAYGNHKFTDKDWGWYDDITYWTIPRYTILYGTSYANDSLRLYHINVTTNKAEIILSEYVGNTAGTYDGAAYDVNSGMLFFSKDNNTLMVNNMNDIYPSFSAGTLDGTTASGTFYNGHYYYVDMNAHTINKVSFDGNWNITGEEVVDNIPSALVINDIAMSPAGDYIYMVGTENGVLKLMSWQLATGTFYAYIITPALNPGAQIAFGADGVLYAIAPTMTGAQAYTLDQFSGSASPIDEDVIIIDDIIFTDLSSGPTF